MNTQWKRYVSSFVLFIILIALFYFLLPLDKFKDANYPNERIYAAISAFLFGTLVGISEIATRYRDEPLKAIKSPYGIVYCFLNGYISLLAFFVILRFSKDLFLSISHSNLLIALTSGFGASAVMRSRFAIIKNSNGDDISIGPDLVIKVILQLVNTGIDRGRSVRRQEIVAKNLGKIRVLGDFANAWQYLFTALLSFQSLDDEQKQMFNDIYNDYKERNDIPPDIKFIALGYIFLTIVGEDNFQSVLEKAKHLKSDSSSNPISTEDNGNSDNP